MNDRTMIAAMFANALCVLREDPDQCARDSVKYADALLKELEDVDAEVERIHRILGVGLTDGISPERVEQIRETTRLEARNEALEDAAQFVERALEESSMLADQIRALKKSEVK